MPLDRVAPTPALTGGALGPVPIQGRYELRLRGHPRSSPRGELNAKTIIAIDRNEPGADVRPPSLSQPPRADDLNFGYEPGPVIDPRPTWRAGTATLASRSESISHG